MTVPNVQQFSARGGGLTALFLVVAAALAVTVASHFPAQASTAASAGEPSLVREARPETLGAVADADQDRGPGEDEAALAKHPQR